MKQSQKGFSISSGSLLPKWDSKRDCFVVAITPSRNDGKILLASFSKGGFKTQKIQGKQMLHL